MPDLLKKLDRLVAAAEAEAKSPQRRPTRDRSNRMTFHLRIPRRPEPQPLMPADHIPIRRVKDR
jgi:hypothetical protein